jgi:uncharacterized protein
MIPGIVLAARMRRALWLALLAACVLGPGALRADDIPPRPPTYFYDADGVVDAATADELNNELANFERQTSNQIVVAVYPKLNTDDSLDDYCYRVFQAWGVGQKKLNNGAVLFVFVQDHKMRIQTGYGLEGALPDVTCVRILDDTMAPYFKRGDYAGGLRAGIDAMIAATKGEYKGTGRTAADTAADTLNHLGSWIIVIIWLTFVVISIMRPRRGMMYGSRGVGFYGGFFGGGGGGGGFSGGGGFGGGGGCSGGGGASGGW